MDTRSEIYFYVIIEKERGVIDQISGFRKEKYDFIYWIFPSYFNFFRNGDNPIMQFIIIIIDEISICFSILLLCGSV